MFVEIFCINKFMFWWFIVLKCRWLGCNFAFKDVGIIWKGIIIGKSHAAYVTINLYTRQSHVLASMSTSWLYYEIFFEGGKLSNVLSRLLLTKIHWVPTRTLGAGTSVSRWVICSSGVISHWTRDFLWSHTLPQPCALFDRVKEGNYLLPKYRQRT